MKKNCIIIGALLLPFFLYAQLPVYKWGARFGNNTSQGSASAINASIDSDPLGNSYIAGGFEHEIDFDPGPGTFIMQAEGVGHRSLYVTKLNTDGNLVWAKQFAIHGPSGLKIEVDQQGNSYLIAGFSVGGDVDPGPGVHTLLPIGSSDVIIIKLDIDGNLVWVKQFGGTQFDTVAHGLDIFISNDGNVLLSGQFVKTVDFDPGPAEFNLTANGHFETFLVKLTTNGSLMWAKKISNKVAYAFSDVTGLYADANGYIYMTGLFQRTCDFDPGVTEFLLTATGQAPNQTYILKLDADGNFVWAKKVGEPETNYTVTSCDIRTDSQGDIVISGNFLGNMDIDPGPATYNLSGNGYVDFYILKLTGNGNFVWAKSFGSTYYENSTALTIDQNDNIYITANIGVDFQVNTSPGGALSNMNYTMVLWKFKSSGTFIYAAPFYNIPSGTCHGSQIIADEPGNITITGYFQGAVDLDPGPAVAAVQQGWGGSFDAFTVKLERCQNITTSNITVNTCNSYQLAGNTFDTSGIYNVIIPNSSGCDSIITLNLSINRKFTEILKTICEGESFYAGGAFQSIAGTYKDTLKTTTGCDSIVTTQLQVANLPVVDLGADVQICAGDSLKLKVNSGYQIYNWNTGSSLDYIYVREPGQYRVIVTNQSGCRAADSMNLLQTYPLPEDFLPDDISICQYEQIQLKPLRSFNTYLWNTALSSQSIRINSPGEYWLEVTDQNGCKGRDYIKISEKQCMTGLYIPSAFTPNADSKNDQLKARLFGNIRYFELRVFNRYGQLVFTTKDPSKGWDGNLKSVKQESGNFVWICRYQINNEPEQVKQGSTLLIR